MNRTIATDDGRTDEQTNTIESHEGTISALQSAGDPELHEAIGREIQRDYEKYVRDARADMMIVGLKPLYNPGGNLERVFAGGVFVRPIADHQDSFRANVDDTFEVTFTMPVQTYPVLDQIRRQLLRAFADASGDGCE